MSTDRDDLAEVLLDQISRTLVAEMWNGPALSRLADAILASDWLAARDRRVAAEALYEAAYATGSMSHPASPDPDHWGAWLHERADRIERGAP